MPASNRNGRNVRLDKFLAQSGVAARRAAKELIRRGQVTVNGAIVQEPGHPIDPERDDVRVDDVRVRPASRRRYLLLHKPRYVLSSHRDTHGRRTVFDLIPPLPERLFLVGRLDYDAEGLMLLTNDGELAFRLTHPRFQVEKTYEVVVKGAATPQQAERLERGVFVEGRRTAPARVEILRSSPERSLLRITIHEGRKRQVKWMCLAVGLPVKRLRRIRLGPLRLGRLPPGGYRELGAEEVRQLRRAVGLSTPSRRQKGDG